MNVKGTETVLVLLFIDGPLYSISKVVAVEIMIVFSMADRYCYQSFFFFFKIFHTFY